MKLDAEDDVPTFFQKGFSVLYGIIFILISIYLIFNYPTNLNEINAFGFIYANIQVLVTIFAVTLGATLLGLQFRAQSYTMLALIHSMKNNIVYGFILIFISLIIFNLFVVIFPHIIDILLSTSLAMIGTIFSLIYLVGYIYHMIKRVQPTEILSDVSDKMQKIHWTKNGPSLTSDEQIKLNEIIEIENKKHPKIDNSRIVYINYMDEKMKWYNIWEQIMTRSIELDNRYIFKQGMKAILDILEIPINNYDIINTKYNNFITVKNHQYITQYIESILVSCIEIERNRFVDDFFDLLKKNKPETKKNFYFRLYMWRYIMDTAVNRNNTRILMHIDQLNHILDIANNDLSKELIPNFHRSGVMVGTSVNVDIYIKFIAPIIHQLLENNQIHPLKLYLQINEIWHISTKNIKGFGYPSTPITVWEAIMHYSIKTNNYHMFDIGMQSIARMLESYLFTMNNDNDKKILSDEINFIIINVMNNALKQNTNNIYIRIFSQYFSSKTPEFLQAWKHIMIDSIHNLNTISFKFGLESIKNMLTDKNSTSTNQKINESLNTLEELYQEYLEHVGEK